MAEMSNLRESQDDSDQVTGRQVKICKPCEKRNKTEIATLFCKDCKQYQCDECSKAHEIFDFMSGHEIVTVDEGSSLKIAFDIKGFDKCKEHDRKLSFYCIEEKKLCCNTCAITSHSGCTNVQNVVEILNDNDKKFLDFSAVESTIQELQDATRNLNVRKDKSNHLRHTRCSA